MTPTESKMKIVTVIQARMGSTRLPGKVLEDIGGRSMLARVIERAARSRYAHSVMVATTTLDRDDPIVRVCADLDVPVSRGSEDDVLDRYYRAACQANAGAVVRVTSDCPLLDPGVMDRVIGAFLEAKPDYASNTVQRHYPRGLDTEVFTMAALETAWREATESHHRTHVTPYFYLSPDRFRVHLVTGQEDHSRHRWTVDTPEDLKLVREIYDRLGHDGGFTWTDVLELLHQHPHLVAINAHVEQKALHKG